ncbi:PH domain-containing protein [Clostridium neuense]|uniref:PH domain-containing protein n=1 Tax=Clostridium neuense TaxID=1728934 RepID=A0ABW8TF79_9CLOT
MKYIKPCKSIFLAIDVILVSVLVNMVTLVIGNYINTYTIIVFFKVFLVVFNLYQIYYLLKCITLKYYYDEDNLYITAFNGLKKVSIPFKEMDMYQKSEGEINGIKLSGYGKNKFAFGIFFVENIGTTNMYCTSTENVIYIKIKEMIYAISPENVKEIEDKLRSLNIPFEHWAYQKNKRLNLGKDRHFMIPFVIVTIVILAMTIVPFIFYWKDMLPAKMPLSFDAKFNPIVYGTAKGFAFKQMMYGAYNMIILFCMYYVSYFYSKYSRKLAYKYIYISLIISSVFFIIQIRILQLF